MQPQYITSLIISESISSRLGIWGDSRVLKHKVSGKFAKVPVFLNLMIRSRKFSIVGIVCMLQQGIVMSNPSVGRQYETDFAWMLSGDFRIAQVGRLVMTGFGRKYLQGNYSILFRTPNA